MEAVFASKREDGVSYCDVTECVLVRVLDLAASSDSESDVLSVSSSVSQLHLVVAETVSLSEKRGASGTLLSKQSKRAQISVE